MTDERRLVRVNDTEVHLTLEKDGRVLLGGEHLHVMPLGSGSWLVRSAEGLTRVVHVAADADEYWVHVDGAVFTMTVGATARALAAPRSAASGELTAPMPATVLSVVAGPGVAVRAGDPVLLLEAMKMELPVRAPRDGIVRAVHCREGELVQPGVTLVEIS
jgi:3-methylcrotonyl-CoA carboxylase alpha subunit